MEEKLLLKTTTLFSEDGAWQRTDDHPSVSAVLLRGSAVCSVPADPPVCTCVCPHVHVCKTMVGLEPGFGSRSWNSWGLLLLGQGQGPEDRARHGGAQACGGEKVYLIRSPSSEVHRLTGFRLIFLVDLERLGKMGLE